MTIQNKDFDRNATLVARVSSSINFESAFARRHRLYASFFKRVFDIIVVVCTAPFVVPIIFVLSILVARDGSSPFYRQHRVGQNGRIFSMWKLRSMMPDADQHLSNLLNNDPAAREEWGKTQKLKNDPRITPFGQILRKSSMDELPQLWNVLLGDMSLVGPRPMLPEQREIYPGMAYYSLRPGLTGYWQISDRNESSFASRARFDTLYYNDVSLSTDAEILARTVGVVLRGTGY
jgi:exopolysaccharide production protein ExoY